MGGRVRRIGEREGAKAEAKPPASSSPEFSEMQREHERDQRLNTIICNEGLPWAIALINVSLPAVESIFFLQRKDSALQSIQQMLEFQLGIVP
ncbi:hypothetical protein Syun_028034 [Stephania yunnanensis]|uniref:Uncharacterized protein n=1 Tax=Stephania yunnanensis TaxID=152371 RepID=A0AAP0EM69_9MAGN